MDPWYYIFEKHVYLILLVVIFEHLMKFSLNNIFKTHYSLCK